MVQQSNNKSHLRLSFFPSFSLLFFRPFSYLVKKVIEIETTHSISILDNRKINFQIENFKTKYSISNIITFKIVSVQNKNVDFYESFYKLNNCNLKSKVITMVNRCKKHFQWEWINEWNGEKKKIKQNTQWINMKTANIPIDIFIQHNVK